MTNDKTNSRLTTDMIADPKLYNLGLMVGEKGMDVVLMSRVNDADFIYRHIDFDRNLEPFKAMEEVVYDNPLLTADFGSIDVVVDNNRYFVMYAGDATPDEIGRRIDMLWPEQQTGLRLEGLVSAAEPGKTVLVSGVQRDVLGFLRRTFNNPAISHRVSALTRYYAIKNRLGNMGKVHVRLGDNRTDIIVFNHQGLQLANTFTTKTVEDAVYYTLAVAKNLGFDEESDRVYVAGDSELRESFLASIRRFVPLVMPEIFPAALTVRGPSVMDAPFELLVNPLVNN